jgi:hypothetical protein
MEWALMLLLEINILIEGLRTKTVALDSPCHP